MLHCKATPHDMGEKIVIYLIFVGSAVFGRRYLSPHSQPNLPEWRIYTAKDPEFSHTVFRPVP